MRGRPDFEDEHCGATADEVMDSLNDEITALRSDLASGAKARALVGPILNAARDLEQADSGLAAARRAYSVRPRSAAAAERLDQARAAREKLIAAVCEAVRKVWPQKEATPHARTDD